MDTTNTIKAPFDAETFAKADALWLIDSQAADNPSVLDGDGRGRALASLIHRTGKARARTEEHRENGEKLKWTFAILAVLSGAFISLLVVDATISGRDEALKQMSAKK